jgi:hypothetical protein
MSIKKKIMIFRNGGKIKDNDFFSTMHMGGRLRWLITLIIWECYSIIMESSTLHRNISISGEIIFKNSNLTLKLSVQF